MQRLVTAAALGMFLLQVVLLCVQRDATSWTFSLLSRAPKEPATSWEQLDKSFMEHRRTMENVSLTLEGVQVATADCVQQAWRTFRPHLPTHCLLRVHNGFTVEAALAAFNPHVILLALCSAHVVCCARRAFPEHVQRLFYATGALGAVNLGVGLLQTSRLGSDGFHYPSIVATIAVFAACFYYLSTAPQEAKEDPYWEVVFHLQAVGAPLVALVFAAMGVRFWDDALYHLTSLLVACNCIWLQQVAARRPLTRLLCATVAIGLPTSSLLLMRHELLAAAATDLWQPMVAHMAFLAAVPLYVLALTGSTTSPKFPFQLAQLCLSASLLITILNLAMF